MPTSVPLTIPILELSTLHKLFDVVKEFVRASGGDGDGWIVSERYAGYADLFEKHEQEGDKWFVNRDNGEGAISFWNGQEAIVFVRDRTKLPPYAGDIVVEIF